MDQHVISGWLLREFSATSPGGLVLATYNKASGAFEPAIPSKFMVEVDAHSAEIEVGIGKIESAAARAAKRLVDRAGDLPPGLYSVAEEDDLTRLKTFGMSVSTGRCGSSWPRGTRLSRRRRGTEMLLGCLPLSCTND